MKILSQRSSFRWSVLVALLLVGLAVVLFVLACRPNAPSFMVLSKPVQLPTTLRDRLLGWVPRGWTWVWRVENSIFGPRKTVTVFADFLSLADSSDATLSRLALGKPSFSDTNGLRIWVLGSDRLKELKGELNPTQGAEMLAHPGIVTASGMSAMMTQGQSLSLGGSPLWAGINLLFSGQVHSDYTDVITSLTLSEFVTNQVPATFDSTHADSVSILTNLDAAIRLQVPKGSGFFLLDGGSNNPARKHFGVIMNFPQKGK